MVPDWTDCPDFTLTTKHEQLSINNKSCTNSVFNKWCFLGGSLKKRHIKAFNICECSQCIFMPLSVGNVNTMSHFKRSVNVLLSSHGSLWPLVYCPSQTCVWVSDFGRLHSKSHSRLFITASKYKSVLEAKGYFVLYMLYIWLYLR